MSSMVDTDPTSWVNWDPEPEGKFRRRFTHVYDGKPFSVFEYGIKPFADSGYDTWKTDIAEIPYLTGEEDDAMWYPG